MESNKVKENAGGGWMNYIVPFGFFITGVVTSLYTSRRLGNNHYGIGYGTFLALCAFPSGISFQSSQEWTEKIKDTKTDNLE
jgi:hypothetical protein